MTSSRAQLIRKHAQYWIDKLQMMPALPPLNHSSSLLLQVRHSSDADRPPVDLIPCEVLQFCWISIAGDKSTLKIVSKLLLWASTWAAASLELAEEYNFWERLPDICTTCPPQCRKHCRMMALMLMTPTSWRTSVWGILSLLVMLKICWRQQMWNVSRSFICRWYRVQHSQL